MIFKELIKLKDLSIILQTEFCALYRICTAFVRLQVGGSELFLTPQSRGVDKDVRLNAFLILQIDYIGKIWRCLYMLHCQKQK